MKLVKTDWRNCLAYDALTDLIRIKFNPDQAIHQGPVVQSWFSVNPELKFNPLF